MSITIGGDFRTLVRVLIIIFSLLASEANADLLSPWHYVRNYNLGVDIGETTDYASLEFEVDPGVYRDESCTERSNNNVVCEHAFVSNSDGFGVFFEQPFKKKGFWHFAI